jgi:hypothetical protein
VTWNNLAIQSRAAPDLFMGASNLWSGGMFTPDLVRYDNTSLGTRIYVHPYTASSTRITVEWGQSDTWVDFAYVGAEAGTFDQPYNTVAEAVSAVSPTGPVHVKAGHSPETIRITKALRLEAYGGSATIGR